MQTTLEELTNHKDLIIDELTELIKRDWQYNQENDILKPVHTQVVHTGFLLLLRRV